MLPISTGVIPFGAVMGTVCSESGLSFFQTMIMNIFVYSGAAQLAAMDLMSKHAAAAVVVLTGLIINLRFLLYSAALSPTLRHSGFFTRLYCAHTLTDQSYAVMTANQDSLAGDREMVRFYIGTAVAMWIIWQTSVISGFAFGNFAPASWGLDFAVPLSFISLVIPTLKNRIYVLVALFSGAVAILLHGLPYRLGLIVTALVSIGFAAWLSRRRA